MPRRKGQWVCKRKNCRKSNFEFSNYCRKCGFNKTNLEDRDVSKIEILWGEKE